MSSACIIIVNYRVADLTIDCLHSLLPEVADDPDLRVIVVNNPSGDDSVRRIKNAINEGGWESWVTLLPLQENRGYANGNNEAIRFVVESDDPPDYVHLLNPDTLIRPGAIRQLIAFMDSHNEVGIAGSRLEDPDGTPQCSAFRFHTLLSELNGALKLGVISKILNHWVVAPPVAESESPTGWVAGASMIIRREVVEDVGYFDEEYFLYFEEVDFCLRSRQAGFECWYVPQSRVVHLVGQSTGVTDTKRAPIRRPQYWFDSRRRYFIKNFGAVYTMMTDLLWAMSFMIWRTRRIVQRKPDRDPPHYLGDFLGNSILVKGPHI